MENITKASVSSRRSIKYGDEFFTSEMSVEASTEGMTEEERTKQVKEMWDYVNSQVDNNLQEAIESWQNTSKVV